MTNQTRRMTPAETLLRVRYALGHYDEPDVVRGVAALRDAHDEHLRALHDVTERWDAAQAYLQHDPECEFRACLGCDDVTRDCHACPGYPCTCGLSDLLGERLSLDEETSDDEQE